MSLDTTAYMACNAYLDHLGQPDWIRAHQEFDKLPEVGKDAWRDVVRTILRHRPLTASPLELVVAQHVLGDFTKLDEVVDGMGDADLVRVAAALANLQSRVTLRQLQRLRD